MEVTLILTLVSKGVLTLVPKWPFEPKGVP